MKVDPNDKKYDEARGRWCKAGRKLLAPIGYERFDAQTGTPMLAVRFVCVVDLEKKGDEGAHVWRNFALSEKGVGFIARFARAMKCTFPFDVALDEDLDKVLMNAPAVVGIVEVETYEWKGKTLEKVEVKQFDTYEGGQDPGWDAILAEAEAVWDEYLEFRKKNPRGATRSNGGDRGGSGNQRSSGRKPVKSGSDYEDDVPF